MEEGGRCLKQLGVGLVVDLRTEFEVEKGNEREFLGKLGIDYVSIPMGTNKDFSPILGKAYTRLRMSINRMARSSNLSEGCSYNTHIIFAASIGEPPPKAIIVSG